MTSKPLAIAGALMLGICAPKLVTADQVGIASRYGVESGSKTANGEPFPTTEPTAAHRTLPFGTRVRVTVLGGASCVVRINDRGPFISGRIIDLSPAAARACHLAGLARVRLAIVK